MDAFYDFITKKHSTNVQIVTDFDLYPFQFYLFTNFNLGTSHNIHWSMGIPQNILMQNYTAHNNQLVAAVSFFSIESVCPE